MTARRHLTIRNLPPEVARALEKERKRRGTSLNATVNDLLRRALGIAVEQERVDNGLRAHAGGWTDEDLEEFERATEMFEQIDPELWR
jgi:plasmid stability protein